ncbi:MAG: hypothetical protein ABJL67_21565 [Sulfitobacter sp.]
MYYVSLQHIIHIEENLNAQWNEISTRLSDKSKVGGGFIDIRTLDKFPYPGASNSDRPYKIRKDTLPKIVSGLKSLGLSHIDEAWFTKEPPAPLPPMTKTTDSFIENVLGQCPVDNETQSRLGNENSGIYTMYRRYLHKKQLVRELIYISDSGEINNSAYLLNGRDGVYKGVCYRVDRIIYCFFFRSHTVFDFACRTIILHAPSLGKQMFMPGTMNRVAKTDGNPLSSDVILQHVAPEESLQGIEQCLRKAHSQADSSIFFNAFPSLEVPKVSLPKGDCEMKIYANLSKPIIRKFSDLDDLNDQTDFPQ